MAEFEKRDRPFPHLLVAQAMPPETVEFCLSLLETAVWERRSSAFYRIDVPDDASVNARVLNEIVMSGAIKDVAMKIESLSPCRSDCDPELEIHRYRSGCGIGPHTDASSGEVRCVINLCRSWDVNGGGVWIIAADSTFSKNPFFLPAINNSGFAFSTGRDTYHGISTVSSNDIYGLTIKFKRQA